MKMIKKFLLLDLLQGLKLTAKQFFARKITVQYPEESTPKSLRFRGLHALLRYPNGQEKCVACKLCAAACPALAITVEAQENPQDNIRYASKYEIDLAKCMFCGLCEEACPVNAIIETGCSNYHFEDHKSQLLTKEQLLEIGENIITGSVGELAVLLDEIKPDHSN